MRMSQQGVLGNYSWSGFVFDALPARLSILFAVLISPAYAQKSPQETIESISTVDGFEVKLFAAEPMIVNPIAIDVDTHGRVWVTEGTKYRRNVGNPPDDKLKVRSEEHTSELQSPV